MTDNRKIVDYNIISVYGEQLDELVNDALKTGWQPLGGPGTTFSSLRNEYCVIQAMVKYEGN